MKRTAFRVIHMIFRVLFTFFVLWAILFIFQNSLESGALSSSRSAEFTAMLNAVLGRLGISALSEAMVRKLAHYAEFALLGFLLMLCVRVYTPRYVRYSCWPLLIGMCVANLDETIQIYVDGRNSSVIDVWIDFSGVCGGLLAGFLVCILLSLILSTFGLRRKR
ncbi:MAG: VanZ family protein [Clostridiales bacterium]|nr:VanZ family protein [Clostridiales bacterium]MCD8367031.1 VanZ family protein [Clostridiales bacterium]